MNKRLLLTAAILVAFIVFGVNGLRENSPGDTPAELLAPQQAAYDYYMRGMVLDRFSPEGSRIYRITADRVTHFPLGDRSILDKPAMSWFESGSKPWLLTANSGVLSPDSTSAEDTLLLQDQVVVQSMTADGEPLTITTNSLTVLPASNEISTTELVTLDSGSTHLRSTGMWADLAADHIKLSSGVSGSYD